MWILVLEDLSNLDAVIESKPDAVCIGLDPLAARTHALVQIEELPQYVERFHCAGIDLYINAQGMIEQSRLNEVGDIFYRAIDAKVDGFYIADDGYIHLADEYGRKTNRDLRSLLIMQPETLLCSGQDAGFYLNLGLQAASLSHELTLDEIAACAHDCGKPEGLEVLICGHYSWMESRRPLIENYLRYTRNQKAFEENRIYTIQEQMREARLPIWQDEKGTHVMSDEPIQAGRSLASMKEAGVRRFRIDAFLKSNVWGIEMLKAYRNLIDQNEEEVVPESNLKEEQTLIRKEKTNVRN